MLAIRSPIPVKMPAMAARPIPLLLLLLSPALALAWSCGGVQSHVREEAAADWGCNEDRLDVRRRTSDTFVVVGCNRQGVYQCSTAYGQTNCVNLAWLARDRASREFSCDAFDVQLEEISPYVFRVEGCDNQATYHCEIVGGRARCLRDERWSVRGTSGG